MKLRISLLLTCALLGALLAVGLCSCAKDNPPADTGTGENTAPATPGFDELILVRPADCSSSFAELCAQTRNYLSRNTDLKISVKGDDVCSYETKDGVAYLLLGDTNFPLSQAAKSGAAAGAVVYQAQDDCFAVYAAEDTLMWVGVQQLLSDCCRDGSFRMEGKYQSLTEDRQSCLRSGWSQPIPAYPDGELDETVYSCGTGLKDTESPSVMQMTTGTTEQTYYAYIDLLRDLGYTVEFSNYIDGNGYTLFPGCCPPAWRFSSRFSQQAGGGWGRSGRGRPPRDRPLRKDSLGGTGRVNPKQIFRQASKPPMAIVDPYCNKLRL